MATITSAPPGTAAADPASVGAYAPPAPAAPVLDTLDFVRGVAIVGVVLVHAVRGWFGWQGVHLFIVTGGFGLAWGLLARGGAVDWRDWARRRVARVLPTYWATVLAGFALVAGATALGAGARDWPAALRQLALDVTLTRDFAYRGMFGDPNASLWYVPFLASCYLAFPWMYRRLRALPPNGRALAGFVLAACAVELAWRAAAMFLLDGKPVAYGHGFLPRLGRVPADLARVPDGFPFQKWAPFGLVFARAGELALGMAGAAWLARDAGGFRRAILGPRAALAGGALWLVGNAALYAGPAGWVPADLLIAAGLTVLVLNAGARLAGRRGRAYRAASWLGHWSYYLFLAHAAVGYALTQAVVLLGVRSKLAMLLIVPAAVLGTVAACRALRALDRSSLPERLARRLAPAAPVR